MNKKLLLVCYSFPPNPGVGGRKWAKLAGYLIKLGWEVHVILREPAPGDSSPWQKDTEGCHLHFLKPRYPSVLDKAPAGVAGKLMYRLSLLSLRLRTASNYYDRAVLQEKPFRQLLNKVMQENGISRLIVSGAPFSLLWYAAAEKKANPEWTCIADIRDSWLSDDFYGFGLIGTERQETEKKRLKEVLTNANVVLVPYEKLAEEYAELSGQTANIRLLPHGTDDAFLKPRKPDHSALELVHFGSHYHHLDKVFRSMASVLKSHKDINISFYTTDHKYRHYFEHAGVMGENCHYNGTIGEAEVFGRLSSAGAALLFTPEYMKDYVSTKYLENAAARIPMLVIGREGKASAFVTENRLGIFIHEDEVESRLPFTADLLARLNYNDQFDISPYLFSRQAEQISELLMKEI